MLAEMIALDKMKEFLDKPSSCGDLMWGRKRDAENDDDAKPPRRPRA